MNETSNLAAETRLRSFLERHGGVAGTVHLLDGEHLRLQAAINIPEHVQASTQLIIRGKGMAGLAWARARPVQTQNLQTDTTGDVRPSARCVHARAAIAIPIDDDDGAFAGVVGLAFAEARELDDDEVGTLTRDAGGVLLARA